MKLTKKLIAVLIAALMLVAVLPVATFAASAVEAQKLAMLANVWKPLEAVEREMVAARASATEVTNALYKAALNETRIDKGSLVWESEEQFAFTVDGMHCAYNYRVGNARHVSTITPAVAEAIAEAGKSCGYAASPDVLLVGPNYNEACTVAGYYDSSFTDQYMTEAQSIADATGGTCTMLGGHNASGPNIAAAYPGKGVVIYDSHGSQSGTSSYLCLTTNDGITTTDYNNGWAVAYGSDEAWIDGRYIQNHISGSLSNCIVWMAICEGMKKAGQGTTGTALLNAGAGIVYGYSQSVTFSGDYKYEATFWTEMKNGASVADAIAVMKDTWGDWDPAYSSSSGAAWPIVMSADDPFPSNPDAAQTVYSDWTLFTQEPVALEGIDITDTDGTTIRTATVAQGKKATIKLAANPYNANNYTASWAIADPTVASIAPSANGKSVMITGLTVGTTTLTVTATTDSKQAFTKSVTVNVTEAPKWNPTTEIVPGEEYLIGYIVDGVTYLAVNYNVNASNNYYNSINYNYYGYTAPATMQGTSVIGVTGNADDLDYCTWIFESAESGYIQSGYESNRYLYPYSSSSYTDLYPNTTAVNWTYDPVDNTLLSASGKYAGYYTDGTMHLMQATTTAPTNGYVMLYSTSAEEPDPSAVYYTVIFQDWDGTVLKTQQVKEGNDATPPTNPTRPLYTFIGWDTDYTNVQSNLVVTALYEAYVAPEGFATIVLTAGDVWGDGSGYQMLLDADAAAYGDIIPETGGLTTSGAASAATYAEFEYKIPENADGALDTTNIVINNSVSITVPAGIYDWCITNPTPGDRVWIASADGGIAGRYDDYEFLPNNIYEFVITLNDDTGHDAVNLTIYDSTVTMYTVTFVDWDGTVLKTQMVPEGEAATAPANPTRPGYSFAGWDVDFSNITADLTVTATYVEKTNIWVPTDTIEAGKEYLVGIVVDGVTYLAVNYNANASNNYYNNISSTYYGYTAPAMMNGDNVIDVSGNATDLEYCTWIFTSGNGGPLQSGFESDRYLHVWSSSSYNDCYPATTADSWTYDADAHTLSTVTSNDLTKYLSYFTDGSVDMMQGTTEVPADCYIQLFVESTDVPPTPAGLLGDVDCNGTVDMSDISMLFSYLNGGNIEISEQGMINADANEDGSVNVMDITAIFNIIANS